MKNLFYLLLINLFIMSCQNQKSEEVGFPTNLTPPIAAEKEHLRILHADTVNDPYYWMNDYFKKGPDSQEVVDYLIAENKYTDSMLSFTKPFQDQLFNEMKARIKETDESVPYFKNGYFYYTRTEDGKQYFKFCRKKESLSAPEEIILDVDKMAEGKAYFAVSGIEISTDNQLVAYGVDEVSRRQYTIYIKDLRTGQVLADKVENTEGDPCFANDNKTFFYTAKNPVTLLSEKIYQHKLGNGQQQDKLVYEEKDKSNYIGVYKSKNEKYIFITSRATLSSESRYIDANQPDQDFKLFQPRQKNVLYSVIPTDEKFYILTNMNAKNFKLMECPLNKTNVTEWKDFVPHNPDILISDVEEFKNFLVLSEVKKGLTEFKVINLKTLKDYYIEFPEPTYTASFATNDDYNSTYLRYRYTSLITPNSVYDYDLNTQEKTLKKQQEVLGGYNRQDYISERFFIKVRDGVEVPVSLVYKKGFKKDGNSPLYLTAYGSYGSSYPINFSSNRLSLLDRGFCIAIAHIRGGEEMGRQWYEDGKLLKKMNTFFDFIDVAKGLIDQHFTSPQHLYAQGGSAGGLLMGAILNLAPNLWNGVIADVPFVDVINTMLDESIPLTTNEFDEWGNPKNKEYYEYMKKYSPYENVSDTANYPNIFVLTGLHDSQVQYFEPAKWVAKMRKTMKDNGKVLLLKTEMDFGHGGASGRFDYLKEVALKYAFFLELEGIKK